MAISSGLAQEEPSFKGEPSERSKRRVVSEPRPVPETVGKGEASSEVKGVAPKQQPQPTQGGPLKQAEIERQRIPCVDRLGLGPEMVVIAAGRFRMGSPDTEVGRSKDEGPQHWVSVVKPFALARCEVSVGEFARFVAETGYETDAETDGHEGCYAFDEAKTDWRPSKDRNWRKPGFQQSDNHPVVCVSWNDTRAYAAWLSARTGRRYRLPTEAEWEYAVRGRPAGTANQKSPLQLAQARFWGDRPENACEFANAYDLTSNKIIREYGWTPHDCDDGEANTAPVGSYYTNPFGLNDMLGNVWEWTSDCWHETYDKAPFDGSAWEQADGGDCNRRVGRGGGWYSKPELVRSAIRGKDNRGEADNRLGFRLARDL